MLCFLKTDPQKLERAVSHMLMLINQSGVRIVFCQPIRSEYYLVPSVLVLTLLGSLRASMIQKPRTSKLRLVRYLRLSTTGPIRLS